MPWIAKGAKYLFGWTKVRSCGKVFIPPEAYNEYDFEGKNEVLLIQGSKASGGFCLTTVERLQQTRLKNFLHVLQYSKETKKFGVPDSTIYISMKKGISWTYLDEYGAYTLSDTVMEYYDIKTNSLLLTGRGSDTGMAVIVRGGIYMAAKQYPDEIKTF